ncbi:MAG: metal-sulfur cluster assembly factor [Actinomycetota bacterium]
MPTAEEVRESLKSVNDPEIGINIVDLGLIYDVEVSDGVKVAVTYTLTSMGCPAGAMIDADIRDAVSSMQEGLEVDTTVVMQPPWTPDKMSDFAKSALGYF